MSKKTRGPNFTSNEKATLIRLIKKYKDRIDNKKTDAVTTKRKNEGWKKVTEEFNSLSSFRVRNTEQLKTRWDNIKRNARKNRGKIKKEITLKGGRPNASPGPYYQGQVEVALVPTQSGLENPLDSDSRSSGLDDESMLDCADATEDTEIKLSEISSRPDVVRPFVLKKEFDESSDTCEPSEVSTATVPPATKIGNSPAWLQRRRPQASLQVKLLKSKLELVETMRKHAEEEAKRKQLILDEQLKQEIIKTAILDLQLSKEKQKE